jgi:hypothetical protein
MYAPSKAHALAGVLLLAGCQPQRQPPDPAVVQRILGACTHSGLFKLAGGAAAIAVPAATLPIAVVNAGVDKVCEDPERFAGDISTVEWVVKNLPARANHGSAADAIRPKVM